MNERERRGRERERERERDQVDAAYPDWEIISGLRDKILKKNTTKQKFEHSFTIATIAMQYKSGGNAMNVFRLLAKEARLLSHKKLRFLFNGIV